MKVFTAITLVATYVTLTSAQNQPGEQLFVPAPSPQPTSPPSAAELQKRQDAATSVCGYISDDSWSYYCRAGYYCGFEATSKQFGCCGLSGTKLTNCYYPTSCADFGKLSTRNTVEVWMTHSCTDSRYPYCATYYESGLSAMGCNAKSKQTIQLQFTLIGGVSVHATTTATSGVTSSGDNAINLTGLPTMTAVVGPATTSAFSQTQATGSVDVVPTANSTSSKNEASDTSNRGHFQALVLSLAGSLLAWL